MYVQTWGLSGGCLHSCVNWVCAMEIIAGSHRKSLSVPCFGSAVGPFAQCLELISKFLYNVKIDHLFYSHHWNCKLEENTKKLKVTGRGQRDKNYELMLIIETRERRKEWDHLELKTVKESNMRKMALFAFFPNIHKCTCCSSCRHLLPKLFSSLP